jgi:biotin carboxylase
MSASGLTDIEGLPLDVRFAENPEAFRPSPGKITQYHPPVNSIRAGF